MVTYGLIVRKVHSSHTELQRRGTVGNTQGRDNVRKLISKRTTITSAALVTCFILCWLPLNVFLLGKLRGFPLHVSKITDRYDFVLNNIQRNQKC